MKNEIRISFEDLGDDLYAVTLEKKGACAAFGLKIEHAPGQHDGVYGDSMWMAHGMFKGKKITAGGESIELAVLNWTATALNMQVLHMLPA